MTPQNPLTGFVATDGGLTFSAVYAQHLKEGVFTVQGLRPPQGRMRWSINPPRWRIAQGNCSGSAGLIFFMQTRQARATYTFSYAPCPSIFLLPPAPPPNPPPPHPLPSSMLNSRVSPPPLFFFLGGGGGGGRGRGVCVVCVKNK